MAQLISGTYSLADEEAIAFLNAATGTTFTAEANEVESVEVITDPDTGERSLMIVVGPKG